MEKLDVEEFFITEDKITRFTQEGLEGVDLFLENYSGDQIRKISGITRSALINYTKTPKCRVSKRGRDGIKNLINFYNEATPEALAEISTAPPGLSQYTERELMLELKRRGLKVTVSV